MVEDIHNLRHVLARDTEKYIARLKDWDREDVKRFSNDLLARGFSAGRVVKYLCTITNINERLPCTFREATSEDMKRYVAWIENSDYTDWTKHDMKVMLKKYFQYLGKESVISWMKIKSVKNGKLPEEILSEDDIKKMVATAYSSRDRALILSLYESGCRIGEFLPLKLKHVTFDKYGAVFRVTGKTGDRRIRLVASTLTLQSWIGEHPAKNDPESFLWCKIPSPYNPKWENGHIKYRYVMRLLTEIAEKAGIKKDVNPHAFRHSRATFMASHLKEPAMREYFGWGSDSEMPATYVHLSGRDIDEAVLSMYGVAEAKRAK